jgi:hypothetical protein
MQGSSQKLCIAKKYSRRQLGLWCPNDKPFDIVRFIWYLYLLFVSVYWLQNRFLMILSPYLMVNYIPVLNDDIRSLEESLEMLRNTQEASWCFAPQSSMAKEIQGYFDSFGKKNTLSLGIVWANPHESTHFGCRWMQQIHGSSRF